MTSDTRFKIALAILLTAFALLFVRNTFAEDKDISLDVYPRAYIGGRTTTLRVRWQIAKHKDNRAYSIAYACESGEESVRVRDMNGVNEPYTFPEWFPNINASGVCSFYACVYRVDGKRRCERIEVSDIRSQE